MSNEQQKKISEPSRDSDQSPGSGVDGTTLARGGAPHVRPVQSTSRVAKWVILTVALFSAVIALLVTWIAVTYVLTPVSSDPNAPAVVVVVRRGMGYRQIADMLENKHLIRRAGGFVLGARLEHVDGKSVAGVYELSPGMTPRAMAVAIALGRTADDFVTIPEGFTVRRIGHLLASHKMADETRFDSLALTDGRDFHLGSQRAPADLEGYLFPDTYRVPHGTTESDIIRMMLDNFRDRVLTLDSGVFAKHPERLPQTLKMASMIEREAKVDEDRPKIAAALENRLRRGMRLQCDATVEYALPNYKKRLFYKDLKIVSPYNTYLNAGLPPTPISNPGIASVEAALHPASANYLFYVAKPDGTHIFSDTEKEHNLAVAQLRALRAKALPEAGDRTKRKTAS